MPPPEPATPQRRRLSKAESDAFTPRRNREENAGGNPKAVQSPECRLSASSCAGRGGLGGLTPCDPIEVAMDAKSLEDHRLRNRWQQSMGVLPGLAECVISGTKVAYADFMGSADVERGTPMRPTTLFRCFSMTKPITAVALMRLVENRRVTLDDPVAKYLPRFQDMKVVRRKSAEALDDAWENAGGGPVKDAVGDEHLEPAERQITLRHLLTHTSGLGYGPDRVGPKEPLKPENAGEASYMPIVEAVDKGRIRSLEEFCDALVELPLFFQPGTQWLYSHGVDVVGRVIEIVSGQPLDVYLRDEVFEPLSMSRTTFSVTPRRANDLAAMYLAEELKAHGPATPRARKKQEELAVKLRRVDGRKPEDSRWCGKHRVLAGGGIMGSCSGGLVSCLSDMTQFVGMLMRHGQTTSGRQFLQQSTVRSMWKDWLALRCVVGHDKGRTRPLPGWPYGPKIGWNCLGHIRQRDGCLYMGGWSTNWSIYPRTRQHPTVSVISMSQSLVYFDVPGWVSRSDELDVAVEFGRAQHRRRVAALTNASLGNDQTQKKKKKKDGTKVAKGVKGAKGSGAKRIRALAVRRITRALRRAAVAKREERIIANVATKRATPDASPKLSGSVDKRRRRSVGAK